MKVAGSAHVMRVHAPTPAQHEAFVRLFDRSARYEDLIKTVESLPASASANSDPSAISRVMHKQRREFEGIAALDFFPPSAARSRAEKGLAQGRRERCSKLLFPDAGAVRPRRPARRSYRPHLR